MDTAHLLIHLGWPAQHLAAKGSLAWRSSFLSSHPPATAQVIVSDGAVHAKVTNISPASCLEPHLDIKWDIEGPQPCLEQYLLLGTDMLLAHSASNATPEAICASALEQFTSLIALLDTQPRFDVLGLRHAETAASFSSDQCA